MALRFCESKPVKIVNDLGNAIELNDNFPKKEIPNYQMISEIAPEDWVELTHQGERFWVVVDIVNEIDNHFEFIGEIRSLLKYYHPFSTDDCIAFDGKNVLNIYSREWKNTTRI